MSVSKLLFKKAAFALCESETDVLTDPEDVLRSAETTDVPQSEKTFLLFPHSRGATPTTVHPETDGNMNYNFFCALVPLNQEHRDIANI